MERPPKDETDPLWQHATRDVRPLNTTMPEAPRGAPPRIQSLNLPDRRDRDPQPTGRATPTIAARQIDARTEQRLRRGQVPIEGRLDLHGYTLTAAHTALRRFLGQAVDRGARCVLVVTGKGDIGTGAFDRPARGAIRRELPVWLAQDPLSHWVLTTAPAKPEHGGTGALYLYLRRQRGR